MFCESQDAQGFLWVAPTNKDNIFRHGVFSQKLLHVLFLTLKGTPAALKR